MDNTITELKMVNYFIGFVLFLHKKYVQFKVLSCQVRGRERIRQTVVEVIKRKKE